MGGRSGQGARCADQLKDTVGKSGEDKDAGRGLGFEATIAPNTTSSLAAEGGNLDRAREAGLYSLKACIARL
jgi:hypothetical protein